MPQSTRKVKAQLAEKFGKPKPESFHFSGIEQYFINHNYPEKGFHRISDKTYHDLDFDQVFMFVDRTISRPGQQYLYATLRTIDPTGYTQPELDKLATLLEEDTSLREDAGVQLSNLSHPDAYYIPSLFLKPHLQPPEWLSLIRFVPVLSLLLIALLPVYSGAFLWLLGLLILNYFIHYWNKKNLFQYVVSLPQLVRLNQVAKELLKHDKLRSETEDVQSATRTLDQLGFAMSFFKLESKLQNEAGVLVEFVTETVKALFLLEPLLLFHTLQRLDKERKQVDRIFRYVSMIDTAISIGSLRAGLTWYCKPTIVPPQKNITGRDLYHPLIENPVANSITLVDKSVLLTGSNMSGKSTFIRTIGINTILAQTLGTCFAREFAIPPIHVFSAIRISDDLLSDKSYYFEEVLTIKSMIEECHSGVQTLFLLDEIFKGTNTIERIAAGKAVLSYLNQGWNIVFVSSHDIELTDYLKDSFELYHFTEIVEGDQIAFDYKLKAGNLKTRNAIRILELNAYPAEVIREARALSEKMTHTALPL